ncbi:MAG: bacterial Ig-like domain-containing protein [Clostridia bacterium]|nr:bacterial Ig-like domain-containing protein [Clostridia bacterium]
MSKNKFIKKLLVAGLCALTATATIGASACKPSNGDDNPPQSTHEHSYSSAWSYNNSAHWHESTCDHDVISDEGAHVWGEDDKCVECGAPRQIIHPALSEEDEGEPEYDADGKILVNYEFNSSDFEVATYENDLVSGIFTLVAGTNIRSKTPQTLFDPETNSVVKQVDYTKSIQMDGAADIVKINAPADGTFVMHVGNGSGSVKADQLTLTKPNGSTETISYYATGSSGPMVEVKINFDSAGEYKITRKGGTSDIYYMSYTAKVENTPIANIRVDAVGSVDYFVGQDFVTDGLAVNAIHDETGRVAPIALGRLEIDYQNFDKTQAGTYQIDISYTKEGKTFKTNYNVNVYSFEGLTLGTDKIIKSSKNTSAGNGVYENHTLRQLYFKGETLSTDGLSVILNGKNGNATYDFLLKDSQYNVSEVDMATAGKKTVNVSFTTNKITKSQSFDIYVIEKDADLATATSVETVVDASIGDSSVGVKNAEGAYQFKTVHQALEFLENSGVSESAAKKISLTAGTYWEKLEIRIPNLTIEGAGVETTKIEYDSLYGIKDAGGFEHTTDSTATLNVRESAVNFNIKNVTISNWFNSVEHFDEKMGPNYGEHRALAMLVQADKVIIEGCALLGYQDTVEFFTGRQYVVDTYIEGTTDFIFGTNNTTYFYNCEIHCITTGKTDGGYITAFKGNNKDANDAVVYGAVFDNCQFTADADVVNNKNTAIGRPWGAYANVAVINSELGGHISKSGYSTGKNERYVSMGSVKPTDSTVKFVEYNNTGDGAITSAVAGMTMLNEADAAKYSDLSVIFATKNGGVSYSTTWMPVTSDTQTYTVTVYGNGEIIGTLEVVEGSALTEDRILEIVADSKFAAYDVDGIYADSNGDNQYAYPNINADGNVYIELSVGAVKESYTLNFRTNTADYVVNSGETKYFGNLEVSGNTGSFAQNGDWYKFLGDATLSVKIKAGTVVTVTTHDGHLAGMFNGADITFEENTTYTFTATLDGTLVLSKADDGSNQCYIGSIGFAVKTIYSESQTINLVGEVNIQNKVEEYMGIEVDASNGGKFALNSSQDWIQFNTGTTLKLYVTPNADITVSLVTYSDGTASVDTSNIADGYIIITSTANGYIKSITLTYNA